MARVPALVRERHKAAERAKHKSRHMKVGVSTAAAIALSWPMSTKGLYETNVEAGVGETANMMLAALSGGASTIALATATGTIFALAMDAKGKQRKWVPCSVSHCARSSSASRRRTTSAA